MKGNETWIEPVVNRTSKTVNFAIRAGRGTPSNGTVTRKGALCLVCSGSVPLDHVKSEGRAGRLGETLLAVVAAGPNGRVFVPADSAQATLQDPVDGPEGPDEEMSTHPQYMGTPRYGLTRFRDLFTHRQISALTTLSLLVGEARDRLLADSVAELDRTETRLADGGSGPAAYADAVATYLAFAVDRSASTLCTVARWTAARQQTVTAFARQAIQMTWDYPEVNPFGGAAGDFGVSVSGVIEAFEGLGGLPAVVRQLDVSKAEAGGSSPLVSTDPPYYDNVPYADLSDFFYVWLRRSLRGIWPALLATLLTPKSEELVADVQRHGSRERAGEFFESGMTTAFARLGQLADPNLPLAVFYAFKQAEDDDDGLASSFSTGWETMLEGLLRAGLTIDGTWPMRSELANRMRSQGSNALASSIVLVCRPRKSDAGVTTRKDLVASLKREMPEALRTLQHGNIAPVDLAQSSIGPGMAIFSRYAKVLEPDGSSMRVRTALALINQVLDELLAEQEGEFDADTRWAIAWYEQFGLSEAAYGTAETLSKAKDTSVAGVVEAGIVAASRGRVRLLARDQYSSGWDPAKDRRIPVWEATQRLVHILLTDGEGAAGDLLARLGGLGETARDLAYRMYHVAERKGWTDEARAYNALVVAWTDLARGAEAARVAQPAQETLGLE